MIDRYVKIVLKCCVTVMVAFTARENTKGRGKHMHRNLRFYSMIAALATVYAMTPNRATAYDAAECDAMVQAYDDDQDGVVCSEYNCSPYEYCSTSAYPSLCMYIVN